MMGIYGGPIMIKRFIGGAILIAALSSCGGVTTVYTVNSSTMDVHAAQDVVKASLTSGRPYLYWVEGSELEHGRITDVRLRKDGIGLLYEGMHISWSLTHDIDYDPAKMASCYFAGIENNPTVLKNSADYYPVSLCAYSVWFPTLQEAKNFADALYVLKRNSTQ
jgi:hypothetical protein